MSEDKKGPMKRDIKFMGWTEEAEKKDSPKPWADFRVCLFSDEIGEIFEDRYWINKILKASGYEIILRRQLRAKRGKRGKK